MQSLAKTVKGRAHHSSTSLRYLCACAVDIDCYRCGRDFQATLELVQEEYQRGLPMASIVVNSGRGMWLLWLLRDPNNANQAHYGAYGDNWNNHLLLYRRIEQHLGGSLAHLGSDRQATDAARHIRIPGSLNTKSETVVQWHIAANEAGELITYRLRGMAQALGIDLKASPKRGRQTGANRGRCPKRVHGKIQAEQNN